MREPGAGLGRGKGFSEGLSGVFSEGFLPGLASMALRSASRAAKAVWSSRMDCAWVRQATRASVMASAMCCW